MIRGVSMDAFLTVVSFWVANGKTVFCSIVCSFWVGRPSGSLVPGVTLTSLGTTNVCEMTWGSVDATFGGDALSGMEEEIPGLGEDEISGFGEEEIFNEEVSGLGGEEILGPREDERSGFGEEEVSGVGEVTSPEASSLIADSAAGMDDGPADALFMSGKE